MDVLSECVGGWIDGRSEFREFSESIFRLAPVDLLQSDILGAHLNRRRRYMVMGMIEGGVVGE